MVEVNGVKVSTIDEVSTVLRTAVEDGKRTCTLLFSQPEIKHGLTNEGIPQVNIDQLNPRMTFNNVPAPSAPSGMAATVKTIWDGAGDVWEW